MMALAASRPVVGVLCCNEFAGRPVQVVADRFIEPLATFAGATVLLVPASAANDLTAVAALLDGLLLTGSRSHVAPARYGADGATADPLDERRDEAALRLAALMIEAGKPVYGICRGMQELNVLFGGTLGEAASASGHHGGSWDDGYDRLLAHCHDVALTEGGVLAGITGSRRLTVNSVHEQGIDRLGGGLSTEAVATHDGLVEAISARACGGDVLAVQWHPEWDVRRSPASRAFFAHFGRSLRGAADDASSASFTPPARADGPRYVGH